MGICRVKALLSAPLPQVWELVSDPRVMHHWVPLTEPVTGPDRPLQPGDRLTQWRMGFLRRRVNELLVEEVIPYRSFRVREVSPARRGMDVTATLSVAEARCQGTTWIEEVVSYSLGDGLLARWADRWVVNPLLQTLMRPMTRRAFHRLAGLLAQGRGTVDKAGAVIPA
jgi:hypothetical protein